MCEIRQDAGGCDCNAVSRVCDSFIEIRSQKLFDAKFSTTPLIAIIPTAEDFAFRFPSGSCVSRIPSPTEGRG